MYRIAICDSSGQDSHQLELAAKELAEEAGVACAVDVYRNIRALAEASATKSYRLFLLETNVGGVSGIDFARRLRFHGNDADVVFVTKSPEYALAAYSVFPTGYVIKPVSKKKLRDPFMHALEKEGKAPELLLRTADGGRARVKVDDILYVEVFRTELDFHCRSGVVVCTGSLAGLLDELPAAQFYRSHRSYIVNLKYVISLEQYAFTLVGGDRVTVAKNRYAEAKGILQQFME